MMKIFKGSLRLSMLSVLLVPVLQVNIAQAAPPTLCAQEGSTCIIPHGEIRDAYYGANGQYAHRVVAGPFSCNSGIFGDPIRGVVKACFVGEANYRYQAPENHLPDTISKSTPAVIAYGVMGDGGVGAGAMGRFTYKVDTRVGCNNMEFGDPAPGSIKACYSGPEFKKCADEGGTCVVSGVALVTYGWFDKWATPRVVSGSIACGNSTFGDPAQGRVKACYTMVQ